MIRNFHVLAVDDSFVDRTVIERLLKSSAYRVTPYIPFTRDTVCSRGLSPATRFWCPTTEGAEEEVENNNEEAPDAFEGPEGEEKEKEESTQRARKTSKYMTKYERARILGTRALQIRSQ